MKLTRRSFFRVAALAAATVPTASRALAASQPVQMEGLPRRVLGKTQQPVTILGLGCAWLAHDKSARNRQGSEAHTRAIIEAALEGGIRYFDTAPNYFRAEERMGPALRSVRDRIFLTTKLDHADAKTAEQDLATSLKLLQTDHVDLLMLHGLGLETFDNLDAARAKDGALSFLRKAKERGLTRFIGFSSHPKKMAAQREFAAATEIDVIQPFINYVSRAENNTEEQIVEFARRQNIGIVAMKVLGGDGQLADDYDRAFRYTLSVPGVACALVGAASPVEVKRAVQAARDFRPLTEQEMQETVALGRKLYESRSRKAALLRRHGRADWGSVALA